MKKLDRYLISNIIKILAITELAGIVLFVIIEFFEHMDIFTSSIQNFFHSIIYIMLKIPYYVNLILPLAFLTSMLILLILMIRNNEVIVVRTSGISSLALMKPFLILSCILIIGTFFIAELVVPPASNAAEYIYRVKIKKEEPYVFFKNYKIWYKRDTIITNIDFFDTKKDTIKGLTVLELSKDYTIVRRLDAAEGTWNDGVWVFRNVVERTFAENKVKSRKTYKKLSGIIQEPPSVFKVVQKNPEEMGYQELAQYIRKLRRDGHDIRRYLVDLYNKISFPFINLIMVFAAFSVGLRYVKTRNISKGILSGIVVGACYWFFHSISLSLGYSEIFPPLFAAWLANIVFLSAGVIGIISLRT